MTGMVEEVWCREWENQVRRRANNVSLMIWHKYSAGDILRTLRRTDTPPIGCKFLILYCVSNNFTSERAHMTLHNIIKSDSPLVQELTSICSMLRYIIQYLKIHPGVQCSTPRPRPIFASLVLQIEPSFCLVEWTVLGLSSGHHEQEHHNVQHCQQGHHHHHGVLCVRHSPIQGDCRDLWHVLHHHHPYKVRSAPAVTKLNGQLGIAPISRNHS